VAELLRLRAARLADVEAVVGDGVRWTYADLLEQVRCCAAGLHGRGLRPGDRVGIWAPNSPRWIVSALAVQYLGATLVTVNTRYKASEARDLLCRTGASTLLTDSGFLGLDYAGSLGTTGTPEQPLAPGLPTLATVVELADHPTRAAVGWTALLAGSDDPSGAARRAVEQVADATTPDATSVIMFTSGTTGRPKGAMLAQGQLLSLFDDYATGLGMGVGDRVLAVNPFFHTFGFAAGILTCALAGATILPVATLDPAAVLDLLVAERVSVVPGPPTLYTMLLDAPARPAGVPDSLRLAVTGASVVPAELVRRMRDELGFSQIITAYGLTESCGAVTMCSLSDPDHVVETTSGRPLPGVTVQIRDPSGGVVGTGVTGEVCVHGPNVMTGYLDDPDATAATVDAEGWLRTGDVGMLDDDGCLHITDRLKDVFIVGGFNAYPAEIEQVLAEHPDVSQSAVVGVPDARLGEVGVAFVVPRPAAVLDPAEVISWCRERMANYKVPRDVVAVDALPRNATGKVVKADLRRRAAPALPPC
jgi:acyl-CoA synthetase (AMP-forming)/AMP-acid ligase II